MIDRVSRRAVIIGTGAVMMAAQGSEALAFPDLQIAEPQDVGFAKDLGDKLDAGTRSGLLRGLHSVLVWRAGKLVLERYYNGQDQSWGRSLGEISFNADTLHDVRSVTKSIVSLLYGIALENGLVPSLDASLLAQFPEYPDLASDPQRANLKVVHALTMTMGLEWDERPPYGDPRNSENAMEMAKDRYRFALDRPVVAAPGSRYIYSGGCVALIGRLIAKGAGKSLTDFARETLFTPLGISNSDWARGSDGVASAASGLRLTPRDLLRIGMLVNAGGKSGDVQIIPRQWIDDSLHAATATGDGLEYGRLWYLGKDTVPAMKGPQAWVGAFGNGGQRLWLMPSANLVTVVTAGSYNHPDQFFIPGRVWREIILPNLLSS